MRKIENEIREKKMKGSREDKQESPEQQEGIGPYVPMILKKSG